MGIDTDRARPDSNGFDDAAPRPSVEIRLLGPVTVRRSDGSLVSPRDWRTAKNLELLRLLALNLYSSVPRTRIADLLWPSVEPSRGRSSLRTAASQIRNVLGAECLDSASDGFALRNVWVDAVAFRALAAQAASARRSGQPAGLCSSTRLSRLSRWGGTATRWSCRPPGRARGDP